MAHRSYLAPNSAKKSSPLGASAVGCFAFPLREPLDELRLTELLSKFIFLMAAIALRSSFELLLVLVGDGVLCMYVCMYVCSVKYEN